MLTGDIRECFWPRGIDGVMVPLRLRSRVCGDLGRLGGGGVRRAAFGLMGLLVVPLDAGPGSEGPGKGCEARAGERALVLWGGLRGGRRMAPLRGGDNISGLLCGCTVGES